jgi:hypothetical protein
MKQSEELNLILDIMDKVRKRARRISQGTSNPTQESLDLLDEESADAYWMLDEYIKSLKEKESASSNLDTPPA